ncbi:type II secretion system protein GspJ, partial [Escherichia coli]
RFFVNGDWQARWDSTGILPQAVEVTLVMDDFAELPRLFLVSKETAE